MKDLYNLIVILVVLCIPYITFAQTGEDIFAKAENHLSSCDALDGTTDNKCKIQDCVPHSAEGTDCTRTQLNGWATDSCYSCKNFVKKIANDAGTGIGHGYCSAYIVQLISDDDPSTNDKPFGHEVPYWEAEPGDIVQINQQSHSTFNSCNESDSEDFIRNVHSAIFSRFVSNDDLYMIEVIDANYGYDIGNQGSDCLSNRATGSGFVTKHNYDIKSYLNDPERTTFIHVYRPGNEHYDHPVIKPSKQNPTSCSAEDTVYESGIPVRCGRGVVSVGTNGFLVEGDTANTFIDFEYVTKPFQVKIEAYREDDSLDTGIHPMMLDWSFEDTEWIQPDPRDKAMYHFDFENLRIHADLAGSNLDDETHTQWEFRVYIREEGDADFTARPKNVFGYKVVPTGTQAYVEDVFPNDWSYSHEITIDHTQVSGEHDFYDFPVLLSTNSLPDHLLDNANRDGSDIRFTSDVLGLEPIPFDIERYQYLPGNPESSSVTIHVRVPHLKVDEDTSIYVWYGNANCDLVHPSDPNGSYNVWDEDYKAVWHLGEGGGTRYDSTMNDNNLTEHNGVSSVESAVGRGAHFGGRGTDQYLSIDGQDQNGLNVSHSYTFEAWLTFDELPTQYGWVRSMSLFSRTGGRYYNLSYEFKLYRHSSGLLYYYGSARKNNRYNGYETFRLYTDVNEDMQYHVVIVRDSEERLYKMHINGLEIDLGSSTRLSYIRNNNVVPFMLNRNGDFNGMMDEVRFSDTARDKDYIRTQYLNQLDPSSFATSVGEPIVH